MNPQSLHRLVDDPRPARVHTPRKVPFRIPLLLRVPVPWVAVEAVVVFRGLEAGVAAPVEAAIAAAVAPADLIDSHVLLARKVWAFPSLSFPGEIPFR